MPGPTDAELLAHPELPRAAVMAALAVRMLRDAGEPITVEAIMRTTGYAKSMVYEARTVLDETFPGWRDSSGAEPSPNGDSSVAEESGGVEIARIEGWEPAVQHYFAEVIGRRSWDLYRDVYSPAWDAVKDQGAGECIAVAVHYVETVRGEPLTGADRKLVAKLVRSFGKASLHGLSRALGVADVDEKGDERPFREVYRYARAAAQNVVQEIRMPRS